MELPLVGRDERQTTFHVNLNLHGRAALLVREQARGRLDHLRDVDGRVLAGARAAEIQKPVRDGLAAERLAANQLQILAQVFDLGRRAVDALDDARLKGLGAGGDGRQRVVYLVHDAGRQAPDGRELLRTRHRAVGLDARRDVFADGDDVRDLAVVAAHRDFADEPVVRRAVVGARLLLDALDSSGGEGALELLLHRLARLPGQDLEDVAADGAAARDALPALLAVAVPRDDAVAAVNGVERDGQGVDDRLGEAALRLGRGRGPLDLAREPPG